FRAGTENVASIVGMAIALKNNCSRIQDNNEHLEKLEDFLRGGYLNRIYICEQEASVIGYNYIKLTTRYLMACSAIKNNHMGITCEDVVIGYILTLKIFKEDLRPEIRKAHTEYSYK
ncbi:MAG: hypothetical protein IJ672_08045, partial [Methanobrevibacter sp.]|nr:hypothetical protein [Methanobrevibacter sp.]